MRILWIVNMVFPDAAEELGMKTSLSGGWLLDLAKNISRTPAIELATMTYYGGSEYKDITVAGIRHFLYPGGGKRLLFDNPKTVDDCKKVVDKFKPDLIHIHGTEYAHSLAIIKAAPSIPTVLTIQGIISRIAEEYFGGLTIKEILSFTRLKDIFKMKTVFNYKWLFNRNAKREKKVLKNIKYVTGRTDWDKSIMLFINPELKYYRCNYNLREAFYESDKWDISKITRHKIVTGAGGYSLKGLHVLIKSIAIVKTKYPDVKLYVPGGNAYEGKIIKPSSYSNFINNLIRELDLEDNIYFTGELNAEKVVEHLITANICIVPSAIEGASATLCEAMMVGTPAICSYRGGMTELLTDGETGFTYDFPEYSMLACRIMEIFENDDIAIRFSKKSMERAVVRHNREKNTKELLKVYEEVYINEQ